MDLEGEKKTLLYSKPLQEQAPTELWKLVSSFIMSYLWV